MKRDLDKILCGLMTVNGTDLWEEYGVFLVEEKRGGRENQNALLTPARTKTTPSVNFREEDGRKYPANLRPASEEREFTLHFAQYADTAEEWVDRYRAFIRFLKTGKDGWLNMTFRELPGLSMRCFYMEAGTFKALTHLAAQGVQASRYKIKFKEPNPSF